MSEGRRAVVYIEPTLDDELDILLGVVGLKQKSRLICHLLDAALRPYRRAILEAQRARVTLDPKSRASGG